MDNGQQENPQSYHAASVPAFNGRALAVIRSAGPPGAITLTASAAGLAAAKATIRAAASPGLRGEHPDSPPPRCSPRPRRPRRR